MYTVASRHTIIKPECIYLYDYVLLIIYKNLRVSSPNQIDVVYAHICTLDK